MNLASRIIDSHVHVWRSGHPGEAALWRQPHPVERLWETLDAAGVAAAVQVTPSPEGWDNSYGTEAAALHPERLWVFGRLDPAAADPAERLRTWLTQTGAVGVRLTFFGRSAAVDGGLLALEPFWDACERLATPVAVFAPDNLTELVRVLERHPRLRLVVDHLGLGVYPGCIDPFAGLSTLPEFAAFEHVRVKVSGLPEVSNEGFPFRDVREHLADAVSRFGAPRLIWGSNHPVVLRACTYAESLDYLEDCEFLTPAQLAWLVGGTLQDLLSACTPAVCPDLQRPASESSA
jgi:predicted TIM-barrel fold metal-dependent hydrolase